MKKDKNNISKERNIYRRGAQALMLSAALLCFAVSALIFFYVIFRGAEYLSFDFVFSSPSYIEERDGIFPNILNTLYIVAATLAMVLPLGVGAAIYLYEYAKSRRFLSVIGGATRTLSGIPSIIYGLVGLNVFCNFLKLGTSLLAGAMTLAVMNLPIVMSSTEESLKSAPPGLRESAFALGAGRWRIIKHIVLPECIDGILSGCILASGKILGESAALMYTAGLAHAANGFITALLSPGATLSVSLYVFAKERGEYDNAFAVASVLMILTLILTLSANFMSERIKKRRYR